MSVFQVSKEMVVDANRCSTDNTIPTQNGFRAVKRGEWIVRGENGECFIVDDLFFQKLFGPVDNADASNRGCPAPSQAKRERHYGA